MPAFSKKAILKKRRWGNGFSEFSFPWCSPFLYVSPLLLSLNDRDVVLGIAPLSDEE